MPMLWRLRMAQIAVAWEGGWPAFWPAAATLLAFLIAASFDLLPALPGFLHAVILVGALAGLGWGGVAAWRAARRPDQHAARRRLERDSGLAHRPLEVLADRLAGAGDDPFTLALWAAHRRRMAVATRSLRLGWPEAGLVRRDPYALRVALALLLLIGTVAAGSDFWPRVGRALVPAFDKADAVAMTGIDLWINPPDYTGLPPLYLGTDAQRTHRPGFDPAKPIAVPAGSTILAQVHGGRRAPKLVLDGETVDFSALDASDFTATAKLDQTRHLAISQSGSVLTGFDISIIPDLPPTTEWTNPPVVTTRGALHLDYLAKDDYGVKALTLEISRPDSDDPPIQIPLAVPAAHKEIKGTSYQDLTPHPWAGLPVELRVSARDAIDQVGISAPIKLTLPERKFRHPVAKAIIDQRKLLSRDITQEDIVAETLDDLASRPALYREDFTVFLALHSAARRLQMTPGREVVPGVEELLWNTALKVDEGDEPEAQRSLREAEQALQDALNHDAPDAEINRLMAQLREAINRYLQAMAQNAQRNGDQQMPPGPNRMMTQQDIAKMLDQMQQMSQSGAKDAAKEALAQLQDLLENLRAGNKPGQADGQGQQMMRGMQDLARRQEQLLDRSYRQAQRNQNGLPSPQGESDTKPGDLAGAQGALRRQLDQMRKQLGQEGGGDVGQALNRAERAMRNAQNALNNQSPGDAVGPQGEALDQLQQAQRELAEQMRQNGEDGTDGEQAGRDPLGRNPPGQGDLDRGDVRIPEESEMHRSREILDELRRRAADRARPQLERDYIDRLLKRF
jgi:uncharacterized protein (TIGR02302 family)